MAVAALPPVCPAPRDTVRRGRRPLIRCPVTLTMTDTLQARIQQDARRRGLTLEAWLVEVAEAYLAEQAALAREPDAADAPPARVPWDDN